MGRKTQWPPIPKREGGQEVLTIQINGKRERYPLGRAGSPESRAEYLRIVKEIEASRGLSHARKSAKVKDVILAYLDRCLAAVCSGQCHRVKTAMGPVLELYGHTPADEFGPVALATVRDEYVRDGYCRKLCNTMVWLVRAAFKHAASIELVPETVHARLLTLDPLRKGRTTAKDHPRILPADADDVTRTLPHLPRVVADMVRVQLLVGCRPGEVCLMRGRDIIRPWKEFDGQPVWLYHLARHKTEWKGGERNIAIGPQAQAVILPYLEGRAPEAYLFSPAESRAAWEAAKRAARKTPIQPSQLDRRKDRPRKTPGDRWVTSAYGACVKKACEKAGVTPWKPNQLRHTAGTRIEAESGREAAQSVLGHNNPTTTSIYSEIAERAGRVAAKAG